MSYGYKLKVRFGGANDAGFTLFSEPMTKTEAYDLRGYVAETAGVQLSAIEVLDHRGNSVPVQRRSRAAS